MWFIDVVGYLTITLSQIYCWVCFERIFEIAQRLAKLWGNLIASSALPGHCPAERWRTRLRPDVWRAGTVVTASRRLSSWLTNVCTVDDSVFLYPAKLQLAGLCNASVIISQILRPDVGSRWRCSRKSWPFGKRPLRENFEKYFRKDSPPLRSTSCV